MIIYLHMHGVYVLKSIVPVRKKQFGDHHVPPMAPAQRGKDKRVQVETYVSSKSRDINALALHHIHHEAI